MDKAKSWLWLIKIYNILLAVLGLIFTSIGCHLAFKKQQCSPSPSTSTFYTTVGILFVFLSLVITLIQLELSEIRKKIG